MTIFYFTGTGNSLFAARKIADATGARLISIPQAIAQPKTYTDDVIGFVYPQYAVGLPKMVRRFILENTFEADYFFAVDLYAFIRMGALGEIAALLPITYGVYLKTPNNFTVVFNPAKNPQAILAKTEKRLERIIADIIGRRNAPIKKRKGEGNATKYFGESKFKVTAGCTKCGTCAKVCPADNIEVGETIVFRSNCESCFGCANLCPAHTIYSKEAMLRRRQYRNPYVLADEIAGANCEKKQTSAETAQR